jgi:predicted nuclease of predicted toxin-antitoxin system
VRFLVDAQLPPALARWLVDRGHEGEHVLDLGLMSSRDRETWARAADTGAVIITKDQDFVTLRSSASNGTAVVWVRLGNTTRRAFLDGFAKLLPEIERVLQAGEKLVEVV